MNTQKFEKLITPALSSLGFDCVRIQFSGGGGQAVRPALQVMAEPCEDREMTVEDCAEISRHAVARRTVLIPIWDQAYHNMILRQDPPSDLNLMSWDSQLATVGEVPSEFLAVQPDGQISVNGNVPAILHQNDRHCAVVESITDQYSVPFSLFSSKSDL